MVHNKQFDDCFVTFCHAKSRKQIISLDQFFWSQQSHFSRLGATDSKFFSRLRKELFSSSLLSLRCNILNFTDREYLNNWYKNNCFIFQRQQRNKSFYVANIINFLLHSCRYVINLFKKEAMTPFRHVNDSCRLKKKEEVFFFGNLDLN